MAARADVVGRDTTEAIIETSVLINFLKIDVEGAEAAVLDGASALIAAQPNNPWFHELRGQALLEAGRADQAIEHHHAVAAADDLRVHADHEHAPVDVLVHNASAWRKDSQ